MPRRRLKRRRRRRRKGQKALKFCYSPFSLLFRLMYRIALLSPRRKCTSLFCVADTRFLHFFSLRLDFIFFTARFSLDPYPLCPHAKKNCSKPFVSEIPAAPLFYIREAGWRELHFRPKSVASPYFPTNPCPEKVLNFSFSQEPFPFPFF